MPAIPSWEFPGIAPLPPGPPSWNHTRIRGPLPSPPWNSYRHPTPCLVETRPLGILFRDFKCEAAFVPASTQSAQACAFKRQYSLYICCVFLQRTVTFQCLVGDRIWTKQSLKVFLRVCVCVCVCVRHPKQAELPTVSVFQRTIIAVGTVFQRTVLFQSHERKSVRFHIYFVPFCTVLYLSLDHLTVVYTKRD